MSQISLLYNHYLETAEPPCVEKQCAMEALADMLPARDYAEFEERLIRAEDKMTEAAFRAGFGAAMRLIKEALA